MSAPWVPEALTADAFQPFGVVIETAGAERVEINQGFATRFHDLGAVDVAAEGGAALISIFEGRPRPRPLTLPLLERHPLGSQSFFPLDAADWLIAVAPDGADGPDLAGLRVFRAGPAQGVTYARGTWHAPLLALDAPQRFLVVDRGGPGVNLEEWPFTADAPRIAV